MADRPRVIGHGQAPPPHPEDGSQIWWADDGAEHVRLHRRHEDGTVEIVPTVNGLPRFAVAPSQRREHGRPVGYDLYEVSQATTVPALWLTPIGWSRTRDGVLKMLQEHAAQGDQKE